MHGNEILRDVEFKDEKPMKTVERIRRILRDNGLEPEENWLETGVPYCYAIRIEIRNITFGANGKGLTKEFALASAYGELMERLQMGAVTRYDLQKDGSYTINNSSNLEAIPAARLLEQNGRWYESYAWKLYQYTGESINPEAILKPLTDAAGHVQCMPFFNLSTQSKAYLPDELRRQIYTTNGCAAGNTPEEAIVQAISEIVERHYQLRILTEEISVPEISDAILQKYPVAYSIITYLRSNGMRVRIKDCSLGGKFPVVCAVLISEKTGKYHTHFGANPIFEIALERALTESFQGRNMDNVASYRDFAYDRKEAISQRALHHELVYGESEKIPDFFIAETVYPVQRQAGFTGGSNRALLKECLEFFARQGYDVLVRNCSCLGFPTYQVIVPGYSEVFVRRLSQKHNDLRYGSYAAKTLRDPAVATMEDMMGLMMHMNVLKQLRTSNAFTSVAKISAKPGNGEEHRLLSATMGYVFYRMKKYREAAQSIDGMLPHVEEGDEEYLIALKRYLCLKLNGYDDGQIRALMQMFHRQETVEEIYNCVGERRNPLERFVLHCEEQCGEQCPLHDSCYQKASNRLAQRIAQKVKGIDFQESAEVLKQLLQ